MKLKRMSYILFLAGITILMYPHVMKIFFEVQNVTEIAEYENLMEHMTDEEIRANIEEVKAYNDYIAREPEKKVSDPFTPIATRGEVDSAPVAAAGSSKPKKITSVGPFGYIDIPRISQKLPIYLGATDENLNKGVAHVDRTSLPIGGVGTHSVIAGHRGFNRSIPFFTHLDQMVTGDRFYIHILGLTLTYEVIGVEIILPDEREKLNIDPEKDLVTLLTCEPYRSNTHRLLVYAMRVDEGEASGEVRKDEHGEGYSGVLSESYTREMPVSSEVKFDNMISYIVVGVGSVLWVAVFILFLRTFRKKADVGMGK
ncbi:MAG TPA: class C sortase [Clostridiaceae bacterium]|nr:class C sortase [Clostridiaceae bacterium]